MTRPLAGGGPGPGAGGDTGGGGGVEAAAGHGSAQTEGDRVAGHTWHSAAHTRYQGYIDIYIYLDIVD